MRVIYAGLILFAALLFYAGSLYVSDFSVVPQVMAAQANIDPPLKTTSRFPDKPLYSADVKINVDNGHGSGFHLEGDVFLTAGHVVANVVATKPFSIVLDDGSVRKAEVLWISKERDIALIKADGTGVGTTTLDCSLPAIGDPITLKGNPMKLDRITTFGFVSGEERQAGDWKSVYIVTAPLIPGQSGGAVYAKDGRVIGVQVGLFLLNLGFTPSATNYGAVVPSKTVCELLARA